MYASLHTSQAFPARCHVCFFHILAKVVLTTATTDCAHVSAATAQESFQICFCLRHQRRIQLHLFPIAGLHFFTRWVSTFFAGLALRVRALRARALHANSGLVIIYLSTHLLTQLVFLFVVFAYAAS